MSEAQIDFVRAHCRIQATQLVPEIALHLAADATGIFTAASELGMVASDLMPPYWAFAWPGGQAAARHLLDHPGDVVGRSVLDIGAGSGIAAIAAAKAGAKNVLAADIDPLAAVAITMNANLNGVAVATVTEDVLGEVPEADLVLIGDLVYEPELAVRVAALLETVASGGIEVLLADRTSAKRPPVAFEFIAEYDAPLTPKLPAHPFERARLWRLKTRRTRQRPSR